MDPTQLSQLQQKLRETHGLRVGPEMARYIAARLRASANPNTAAGADANTAPAAPPFPIIAHDARTGHPLARDLNPAEFPAEFPAG